MCAMIIMACHDTDENGRYEYTRETLISLERTVDWDKHRIIVVDNGSCEKTKNLLKNFVFFGNTTLAGNFGPKLKGIQVITNGQNLGTAAAINQGLKLRNPGEHCVKMDNDVVIHQKGWADQLEEAINREPRIGVLGLKRTDLAEWPLKDDWAHSEFIALPHEPGQSWICVEQVHHVMGTCQMLSSALLDKLGYFFQGDGNLYGFDDSLLSLRSTLAGFINAFLFHIPITHIDRGGDAYSKWKQDSSGAFMGEYNRICEEYKTGQRPLYHEI